MYIYIFFVANLGTFFFSLIWGHPLFPTPYNGVKSMQLKGLDAPTVVTTNHHSTNLSTTLTQAKKC